MNFVKASNAAHAAVRVPTDHAPKDLIFPNSHSRLLSSSRRRRTQSESLGSFSFGATGFLLQASGRFCYGFSRRHARSQCPGESIQPVILMMALAQPWFRFSHAHADTVPRPPVTAQARRSSMSKVFGCISTVNGANTPARAIKGHRQRANRKCFILEF